MEFIEKVFGKHETIITEGHFASNLYIIREGKVEVLRRSKTGKEVKLAELGEGEIFGEMSLLDTEHSIHSATVRAVDSAKVAIVNKNDFDKYLGQLTPLMKKLIMSLVQKLRDTSSRLCALTEEDK